ncbi:MAG: outer membrane beta-barrel protein [Bacteroidales bacterium]
MKDFDDIFSRKAKEAFENYDADHLAEEGWNAYVSRYGRRRSRAIFIPLWARAASIIVLVTAGVLFINRLNHRQPGDPADQIAQETRSALADSLLSEEDTASLIPARESTDQASVASVNLARQARQPDNKKRDDDLDDAAGPFLAESIKPDGIYGGIHAEIFAGVSPGETSGVSSATSSGVPSGISSGDQSGATSRVTIAAGPIEKRLTDEAEPRLNLHPKPTPKDYLALPRERMTTTLMTGFSGMMASIDNARSNAQGVSIGFYVERQLSRRISVRPGLAMARHSYALENTPGGSAAFDYAAPELNGMSGTTTSFNADINVVSMEVPVNFVFSIRKRGESNLFVTTGASSVLYLNQHLSGNYNNTYTKTIVDSYGDVSYESMTTSVRVDSEQELLNRVDFLGLANFSVGYSFPFAGFSHLVFEPFVQFPIKDLTSMNLRIRYGGLSFKVQF